MPLVPVAPPQPVPVFGGFDYVTVDATRRRVYAAHSASRAVTIVDADSGRVLGQVRVGGLHGVAVDPASGHVFTGNGGDRSISEVDPVAQKVLRSVAVDGIIDAVIFDASENRLYADEDDGTRVFVIDAATMKQVGVVNLPGHKPEYMAVDPATHELYQNIADMSEVVAVDAASFSVLRTIATPEVGSNHPLQFDAAHKHVLVGGTKGALSAYDPNGKLVGSVAVQQRIDQCDLDQQSHLMACAGDGVLTLVRDNANGAPTVVAQAKVPAGVHTVGIDARTGNAWVVWAQPDGDFVQGYHLAP